MEQNKIAKRVQFPAQDNGKCSDQQYQNDLNADAIPSQYTLEEG